ncbi:DUF6713 family protein [Marinilabilia sp.]|uniref:DUF6713 family protein n=1 Tax=Marinilabilia sp. TaxID=2021252 RepID=UPI0025C099A6|nr:DUF6713 family protein [Marinilabilia sp.]
MDLSLLFWIYLINSVILINHEIDSAYWQEWKLVNPNDTSDVKGFLIIHFPMLFAILFGLILIDRGLIAGYVISLIVAAGGIFAFFFHFYHLRKGRKEFNNWLSKLILILTFPISIFQIALTIMDLI